MLCSNGPAPSICPTPLFKCFRHLDHLGVEKEFLFSSSNSLGLTAEARTLDLPRHKLKSEADLSTRRRKIRRDRSIHG